MQEKREIWQAVIPAQKKISEATPKTKIFMGPAEAVLCFSRAVC